jgi:hypothetical protein
VLELSTSRCENFPSCRERFGGVRNGEMHCGTDMGNLEEDVGLFCLGVVLY